MKASGSDLDRLRVCMMAAKLAELDDQEVTSAILIGRAQSNAKTADDFAQVADRVIASLDRMTEELAALNQEMRTILARYD